MGHCQVTIASIIAEIQVGVGEGWGAGDGVK